jgi:hypothetical protein
MIECLILGCRSAQRYVVKRTLLAVLDELRHELPGLQAQIVEINDYSEIERYTSILIFPSLVINKRLVCRGRFPSKAEVKRWLRAAALLEKETLIVSG